jgi:hypothetical protein
VIAPGCAIPNEYIPIKSVRTNELALASWFTGSRGRRLHVDAELRDAETREVLAEARGALLHVPLEHFLVTPEGRAAGEAWRRRLHPDED